MADKKSFCNNCKANGVETEIIWNQNNKSASGKMIPMEVDGKNHSCPFRPKWNGPNTTSTAPAGNIVVPPRAEKVAANTSDFDAAVTRLESDMQRIKDSLVRIEQTLAGLLLSKTPEPVKA